MAEKDLILIDELQYYWSFDDGTTWLQATEVVEFEPSVDIKKYEQVYKDRKNGISVPTGKSTNIPFSLDLWTPSDLQDKLLEIEDEINVPVQVCRVKMWKPDATTPTKYEAKRANFALVQNPLNGSAGEAIRASGELSMTSDGWTAGSFDTSTKTFTADV